jgi:hypothetical protein
MNTIQLKLMWVGISLIVLFMLFPPWLVKDGSSEWWYYGCDFVMTGPMKSNQQGTSTNGGPVIYKTYRSPFSCSRIDMSRLVVETVPIILLAGGLIISLKEKDKLKND